VTTDDAHRGGEDQDQHDGTGKGINGVRAEPAESRPGSSTADLTGSWRTERAVYVERVAPCGNACPAGEDVRSWLYDAESSGGGYEAAWRRIMEVNPMPAVMGRVCYHPCETACNRGNLDEAVGINWRDVTFLDMANMSSGHGHGGDEEDPDYSCWYEALSEDAKTYFSIASPRDYEPGTERNYRDRDAYLLGVAEDALLKSHEGADASIWRMIEREVYRPIWIFNAPSNSTVEWDGSRGQPLMAYGYYPTVDDLAKIGMFYRRHGKWNGRQILNRKLVNTLLPTTTESPLRSPDPEYYLNWWVDHTPLIGTSITCRGLATIPSRCCLDTWLDYRLPTHPTYQPSHGQFRTRVAHNSSAPL
jgi:hypothetical protein